jgi:hypothetical protein
MRPMVALLIPLFALSSAVAFAQPGRPIQPGHDMNDANRLEPQMLDQMEKERRAQAGSRTPASTQSGHEMNTWNELDPRMRTRMENEWKKRAGKDGQITKQQFMQAMEGHWHTLEKRHGHAGKVKPEDMPRIMMFMSGQDTAP